GGQPRQPVAQPVVETERAAVDEGEYHRRVERLGRAGDAHVVVDARSATGLQVGDPGPHHAAVAVAPEHGDHAGRTSGAVHELLDLLPEASAVVRFGRGGGAGRPRAQGGDADREDGRYPQPGTEPRAGGAGRQGAHWHGDSRGGGERNGRHSLTAGPRRGSPYCGIRSKGAPPGARAGRVGAAPHEMPGRFRPLVMRRGAENGSAGRRGRTWLPDGTTGAGPGGGRRRGCCGGWASGVPGTSWW